MAVSESVRKAASLAVIGALVTVSAWLAAPRRASGPVPSHNLTFAVSSPPAVAVVAPLASGSDPATTLLLPPVQSAFRVDSEREYAPTQGLGTSEGEELRTRELAAVETRGPATITAATLHADAGRRAPARTNPVNRALGTAGRQTRGAFATAGRAIRGALTSWPSHP